MSETVGASVDGICYQVIDRGNGRARVVASTPIARLNLFSQVFDLDDPLDQVNGP